MNTVGQWIAFALSIYWVILIVRIVFDFVQMLNRSWTPRGVMLVFAEVIYTITDPPIRFLRRFIPPVRIGSISFDLAFLILIGTTLIAEGFGQKIPKGYIYASMAFSVFVEMLNIAVRNRAKSKAEPVHLHEKMHA